VIDDFSLLTGGVRCRVGGKDTKIIQHPNGQLILEKNVVGINEGGRPQDESKGAKNKVVIRNVNDKSYALTLLRAAYGLIAVFMGGFLFIVGLDILLFLFIDLGTKLGLSSVEGEGLDVGAFILTLLSVPVFVYSLAMGMTLVTKFVIDTFNGHPFLMSFGFGRVATEWLAFVMYLGIPACIFIVTLFIGSPDFWEISIMGWFGCVLGFWLFFSACFIYFEVSACLHIMAEEEGTGTNLTPLQWLNLASGAVIKTMRYRLSGTHTTYRKKYLDEDIASMVPKEAEDVMNRCIKCRNSCSEDFFAQGPYSYFANKPWNRCFDHSLAIENRHYRSVQEVMSTSVYVTRYSWSLEKLFLRGGGINSSIPVTSGPARLTQKQINSNLACVIIGNAILALLLIGLAVWFDLSGTPLVIVSIVIVAHFTKIAFTRYRLWGIRKDVIKADRDQNQSTVAFRYWETHQKSEPKDGCTLFSIALECILLYLVPLVYLCVTKNAPAAGGFAVLGLFSALRHYVNPGILLVQNEHLNFFDKRLDSEDSTDCDKRQRRRRWKTSNLMYHVVRVSTDSTRTFWVSTYLCLVIFFLLVVTYAAYDANSGMDDGFTSNRAILTRSFTYPPSSGLPYPTCRLKKGFGGESELEDFAFLSNLAYSPEDEVDRLLDTWYGVENYAKNDKIAVEDYEAAARLEDYGIVSHVSYRLITFAETPGGVDTGGIVIIRGTSTIWDVMSDAQLWLSALLFQVLRWLIPMGDVFTPVLHRVVRMVNELESDSIEKVSFYRATVGFVRWLKRERGSEYKVQVTGHSLGGGVAMITGAIAKVPSVGISGPNSMLSRDSFSEPVSVYDLNTLTFNVVPKHDIIPMVDDKARLYQNINCTAAANDFAGCHDIQRTICEIQTTCGSDTRAVLCECYFDYDYAAPLPKLEDGEAGEQDEALFTDTCLTLCDEQAGENSEKCSEWRDKLSSM